MWEDIGGGLKRVITLQPLMREALLKKPRTTNWVKIQTEGRRGIAKIGN